MSINISTNIKVNVLGFWQINTRKSQNLGVPVKPPVFSQSGNTTQTPSPQPR